MVCTPTGRISRYLYGVIYPTQTLKLSMVEAGEGKIGSTLDRVLLYCFHYDATSGRYAPVAIRIMKIAAGITLTALLAGLAPIWLRRRAPTATAGRVCRRTRQRRCGMSEYMSSGWTANGSLLASVNSYCSPHHGRRRLDKSMTCSTSSCWFPCSSSRSLSGAMILFLVKYRARPDGSRASLARTHTSLEVAWTIVPGIFVGVIFFWGFVGFLDMRQPPDDSYEIQVTAKKWSWSFSYPNGHVDNNLHVPVDRPCDW